MRCSLMRIFPSATRGAISTALCHALTVSRTACRRAALDLAIIGVLDDGGIRRSEAAALTWANVEL